MLVNILVDDKTHLVWRFHQNDIWLIEVFCVLGNNNASPKDGLQWRGCRGSNNGVVHQRSGIIDGSTAVECGGIGVDGGQGTGDGMEGSPAGGPDQLEGPGAITDDAVHLKRRVGLISGVALIVGTMIGKAPLIPSSLHQ